MIQLKIGEGGKANENVLYQHGAGSRVDLIGFDIKEFGFKDGHGGVLSPLSIIFQLNELLVVL